MMIKRIITCIHKIDRDNPYERIQSIGGLDWHMSLSQAIRGIESKKFVFYVFQNGKEVEVIPATSPSGNRYLRTVADSQESNNLLSLPECHQL